jgi:RimJ/RimL family protein N-acetyltransferase
MLKERAQMLTEADVSLSGSFVALERMQHDHVAALQEAVQDGALWQLWYANVPSPDEMATYVNTAIQSSTKGTMAFVVKDLQSQRVVGTTRFYDVEPAHKRGLIGYTWYAKSAQGTAINTEAKYLLMQYWFEVQQANAVEFRTHFFNQSSRRAIERLGAKQDGILRSHQILKDGSVRDTVVYSIIASEWPAVKNNLQAKLAKFRNAANPDA